MTGLTPDGIRTDPQDPDTVLAATVDGIQSARGIINRNLFDIIDDVGMYEAGAIGSGWWWHADADFDERAWLKAGVIVCRRTGDLFAENGRMVRKGWARTRSGRSTMKALS